MDEIEKVVIVGPAHPYRGGIAHFNESLARSLTEENISAIIASFTLQYPSVLFPGKTQFTDNAPPDDIVIHRWISSINPLNWLNTAKKIYNLKPDLVIIRYWHPFMAPALGTIASKLSGNKIKVIGLVDNAIPHEPRFYDKSFLRYFARNCSAFFTLSESVATDLRSLGLNKPVETSPHPIYDIFGDHVSKSTARRKLQLSQDEPIVLFFGFIRAYKGLDLLLQALSDDMLRQLNIKLMVAGEFYDDKKKYLDLIEELNIADSVVIRDDYIPEDRVKYYFGAANLVAQTYKTATQSGVTQIAYNFDKPMLVTDVGGLSEIVEDGVSGYVVEPEPKAIARALHRYFTESREESFVQAVKTRKEMFSWSFFTKKLLSFANSL